MVHSLRNDYKSVVVTPVRSYFETVLVKLSNSKSCHYNVMNPIDQFEIKSMVNTADCHETLSNDFRVQLQARGGCISIGGMPLSSWSQYCHCLGTFDSSNRSLRFGGMLKSHCLPAQFVPVFFSLNIRVHTDTMLQST